jgi:UDP-N-acetylglucosamine--N-acetylmuramyl-(pentapeptide) pyrophosphoryl-undecaprenol N-acetylglucosamine transferase
MFRTASERAGRAFLNVGEHERILLVLGGSQGAAEVNDLVGETLSTLTLTYVVVHQTGAVSPPPETPSARYKPYAYFGDELPHLLAAAELVLGRSGAGTLWECAAAGKPMLLIPLRGSGTRGDQVENARFFEKAGAAVVLAEADIKPETFVAAVRSLAGDEAKRNAMAAAAARLGGLDSANSIADSIRQEAAS